MREITGDSIAKSGLKIMLKCIVAVFMCFIVFVSLFFVCNYIFTNNIGYDVYVFDEETQQYVLEYTHRYEDSAVDEKLTALEASGAYYRKIDVRSELDGFEYYATAVITQLFSLIILFSLIYIDMWKIGDRERNLAEFGHIKPDEYKGLKIGAFASIPFAVLYVMLILCKLGVLPENFYSIYRVLNSHIFMVLTAILGAEPTLASAGWLSIAVCVLFLSIVPIMCQIGYSFGAKGILIKEKLIYKS